MNEIGKSSEVVEPECGPASGHHHEDVGLGDVSPVHRQAVLDALGVEEEDRLLRQAWRIPMKTNFWLSHGWNGCVTRSVLASRSGSGVVDGVLQRPGRGRERPVQMRVNSSPGTVANGRRRGAGNPRLGGLVEQPEASRR